jgi:transposase
MEKVKNLVTALKPYSKKEMATFYSVCPRTFSRWLKRFENEVGKQEGRYYTISQVKTIFKKLGLPSEIAEMETEKHEY